MGSRALALPAASPGAGRAQAAVSGIESLLENPVRAVLYLKGSGPSIVQNQQSLVHVQRQRIDEQERRLDELSAENRSLWEHQQLLQAHPCVRHRRSRYWPSGPLLSPLPLAAGNLQDQGQRSAAAPHPAPEQMPLQHHGQLLAQPSLLAAGLTQPNRPTSSRDTWGRYIQGEGGSTELLRSSRSPSSVQIPRALGKGVLSRRPESTGLKFSLPAQQSEIELGCSSLVGEGCLQHQGPGFQDVSQGDPLDTHIFTPSHKDVS
uniref:Uncharacterized protein n=1 Tax=Theropithecus gelada TaxID=9565 RepID=A0A8D2F5N2_THEGE